MALTPMMQQYLEIKESNPDALLMFRLGDFYELFFEDAVTASKVLEITLTGRDAGEQGRVPMCGVPHHAAQQYIGRLIDNGYCVAICEQVEDPKAAKGLVKREVIQVVTPGTWLKDGESESRFLAAVTKVGLLIGIAFVDVGTGEVWYGSASDEEALRELLVSYRPLEMLISDAESALAPKLEEYCKETTARLSTVPHSSTRSKQELSSITRQYRVVHTEALGLETPSAEAAAVGRLMLYLEETQKQVLSHLKSPRSFENAGQAFLDVVAKRNLELLETQRNRQKKGSLYGLLDKTKTAMGSRQMRRWIEHPLMNVARIEARLEAVEWLLGELFVRAELQEWLARVYDLERLIGKVGFGSANARDLVAIAQSLQAVPQVQARLNAAPPRLLSQLSQDLPDLSQRAAQILNILVDQPPLSVHDGGMIREGADEDLDAFRHMHVDGKEWLAQFEQEEKEKTGIRTLKVGYNKVFGYFVEVSKANVHLVPDRYERKQTLASAERYTLPELKAREDEILHAEERALAREYEIFVSLRDEVAAAIPAIQKTAERLAELDAILSLATAAVEYGYVRPVVVEERGIEIVNGRHPMVEAAAPLSFVPNSVDLGSGCDFILLTGPNMAGKSTYMRQIALIVLMAQIGSFVPADSARIGVVDRVFTRIGASDDLGAGQSTFMVEMVELAQILRQSTPRSLVLLDEIGRGTSTYDGMSLAEAVMEALLVPGRNPLTLFATHYHELTERAVALKRVENFSVAVQETKDGVTFLHAVVPRPADKSYGIQVAKLAGVPGAVIKRATEILAEREQEAASGRRMLAGADAAAEAATAVEAEAPTVPAEVLDWLAEVEGLAVERMTPIEAIGRLDEVVRRAREVSTWAKSR
ncbi:DNA mismatch repair protein MutS [Alicyclobacillus mengziensis]|uniref:DNA mismatch repair protein MutS n=1 Tax=Alicyclobacillus mengziensis TaxID=2931921 RepID=A0A9X7VUH8_9BACL|nr:DNA mismatch repair protein MutS [Alicyclobacillus mengziensis]QSO45426.1 DNA mismatch repair protein MutS [Alicyclobacillus mengziensis]